MNAPTCFGPSGPSSGSLCRALLSYNFVELVSKNTSLYVQQCCGKKCFKLWCVLCAVQCVTHIHCTALNTHTVNKQNCNFSKAQHRLPEDGPGGPKHVGANMRYFNCTF